MEDLDEIKIPPKSNRLKKEIFLILFIITFILTFRSVVFEPYRIPTGSMIPTLKIGDYIVVNKFAYGFKIPFSDMAFGDINLNPKYITSQSLPKRGEVIVFKFPKDPSTSYIKRVIGLPGDTVEIKDKIVYVNDQPLKTTAIDGTEFLKDMNKKFKNYKLNFYTEISDSGEHVIQQDSDNYYSNNKDKVQVKEGHLYVMGDNRDFSFDSRYWSTVPVEYVKGRAEMIWLSVSFPQDGGEFIFRSDRIGKSIK